MNNATYEFMQSIKSFSLAGIIQHIESYITKLIRLDSEISKHMNEDLTNKSSLADKYRTRIYILMNELVRRESSEVTYKTQSMKIEGLNHNVTTSYGLVANFEYDFYKNPSAIYDLIAKYKQ